MFSKYRTPNSDVDTGIWGIVVDRDISTFRDITTHDEVIKRLHLWSLGPKSKCEANKSLGPNVHLQLFKPVSCSSVKELPVFIEISTIINQALNAHLDPSSLLLVSSRLLVFSPFYLSKNLHSIVVSSVEGPNGTHALQYSWDIRAITDVTDNTEIVHEMSTVLFCFLRMVGVDSDNHFEAKKIYPSGKSTALMAGSIRFSLDSEPDLFVINNASVPNNQ
jgi:hypothetical protein